MPQNRFSHNIVRLVCAAMLITQLTCYKLWLAHEGFPAFPVADVFGGWPAWLQAGMFYISFLLMLIAVVKPLRSVVGLLLFLQLLICLADQNRWQAWQYQYMFMLGTWLFIKEDRQRLWGWQVIMVGTYFFSALWKLNTAFILDVWIGFILKGWLGITDPASWVYRLGYLLPMVEIFSAIGLCFSCSRRLSAGLLAGMHLLILLMLGPLGMNVNYVLWPWNVAMLLLLSALFYKSSFLWIKPGEWKPFTWLIVLCWLLLPWLYKADLWDRYLSSVLFNENASLMYICTQNASALEELKPYMRKNSLLPCNEAISVYHWGESIMNTIPYPQKRNYKHIAGYWMSHYRDSSARFYIYQPGFTNRMVEIKP